MIKIQIMSAHTKHNYAQCTREDCDDCWKMKCEHAQDAVRRNTSDNE